MPEKQRTLLAFGNRSGDAFPDLPLSHSTTSGILWKVTYAANFSSNSRRGYTSEQVSPARLEYKIDAGQLGRKSGQVRFIPSTVIWQTNINCSIHINSYGQPRISKVMVNKGLLIALKIMLNYRNQIFYTQFQLVGLKPKKFDFSQDIRSFCLALTFYA